MQNKLGKMAKYFAGQSTGKPQYAVSLTSSFVTLFYGAGVTHSVDVQIRYSKNHQDHANTSGDTKIKKVVHFELQSLTHPLYRHEYHTWRYINRHLQANVP